MSEEGLARSALLMMAIGEAHAAEVFKHLAPREVQKLGQAMAGLKNVTREQIARALDAFRVEADQRTVIGLGADQYVRGVLSKALGEEKAGSVMDRIAQTEPSGIEGLKWMDSRSVAELIGAEHPQIIATVLVHLDRDQAAEVLACFPDEQRADIVLRIATLDGIQPSALRELNGALARLVATSGNIQKTPVGGVRAAAEILNFVGAAAEGMLIEAVRKHDSELAQKIQDQMFVFDNLLGLDDKSIQLLLREVQSESLIVALKGASEQLREKVFKNMSQRASEMLKEDLEAKGPVRVSEVEMQQKEILKILRRLSEEGQIAMGGKGGEGYV